MRNLVPLGDQGADHQEQTNQDRKYPRDLPYAVSCALLRTKVTLLKSLPSCREMMAKSSGLCWAYSGSASVTTVPPWPRRKIIAFEQRLHSQKYSVLLGRLLEFNLPPEPGVGSASSRKNLPSCKERTKTEQDGLAHFANISEPIALLCLHFAFAVYSSSVTCSTGHCDRRSKEQFVW